MPSTRKINKTNSFFSIGVLGIVAGVIFLAHAHAIQSEIGIRKTEIRRLRIDNRHLSGKLSTTTGIVRQHSSQRPSVSTNTVLVLSRLRKTAVTHHIVLSQVIPESSASGVSAASNLGLDLDDARSASVRYPGLQVIKVRIEGEWQDYTALKSWLMAFGHLPVSIVHLDIGANNFDMEIVIYGA